MIQTLPQRVVLRLDRGQQQWHLLKVQPTHLTHLGVIMELFKPKGALQPRRPTDNTQQKWSNC
jgi:hypothetical protein